MLEKTFAGSIRRRLTVYKDSHKEMEFYSIGRDLFSGEDLVNSIYEIYLPLCSDGWVANGKLLESAEDIATVYRNGFYLPCEERIVLNGQIDLTNDGAPNYAGIIEYDEDGIHFCSARRAAPPVGVSAPAFCDTYAVSRFYQNKGDNRLLRRRDLGSTLRFYTVYLAVTPSGAVIPCMARQGEYNGYTAAIYAAVTQSGAVALNAWSDKKHLWNVSTSESVFGKPTPLILGVSESHIKSVFYARSLPMTESGRKRPILHWVRAHQRRLREGVDIDVRKHMRGITEFEMEGFRFQIVSPQKDALPKAA